MTERLPQPERRYLDEDLIDMDITVAEAKATQISPAAARMIASQIYYGQSSGLYSFVSTGRIDQKAKDEVSYELRLATEQNNTALARRLESLSEYFKRRTESGTDTSAVIDFHQYWLDSPEDVPDALCPCCEEDVTRNHRVGCPLGVDDEGQLNRVKQLRREYGTAILHWLDYLGFRSDGELEDAARSFSDHYYGFYPDMGTFRQSYEMGPEEYLDQSYLIVEGDGGIYVFDR